MKEKNFPDKIKVVIIDTGIDLEDIEIKDNIYFNRNLQIMDFESKFKDIDDKNGHGTLCAKTILSLCNNVEIYPIKIFDETGNSNSKLLVEVLHNIYTSDIRFDIINISASSLESDYEYELKNICTKLSTKNSLIISSNHNENIDTVSVPTKFDNVLGIQGHYNIYTDNEFVYNPKQEVQIYANSKAKLMMFKNKVTTFGKNSRSAAVFSGLVANYFIQNNCKNINNFLENYSKSINEISQNSIENFIQESSLTDNKLKIANKVVSIINNNFAHDHIDFKFLEKNSIFDLKAGIGIYNLHLFLSKLSEDFNISINYNTLFVYHFYFIKNIINIIYDAIYINLTRESKNN